MMNEKWLEKYNLALAYFRKNGNSDIPLNFKTNDGINYDENGIQLGQWLSTQKKIHNGTAHYGSLDSKQEKLLEDIKIKWNRNKKSKLSSWNHKYELAKAYFEENGNSDIPLNFKTSDGINYDENGIQLGQWLSTQKKMHNGTAHYGSLDSKQEKLLEDIKIKWNGNKKSKLSSWDHKYKLAKAYFEENGNLEIPMRFKTLDGIHYDENGECLGAWIQSQRQAKKKGNISDARKKDLDKIGMVWSRIGNNDYIPSSWTKNYELAKNFHDEYKNLRIQQNFKTLDGIHYDENGINLGSWIQTQRQIHNGKKNYKLNQKQIDLLEDIGMNWKGVYIFEKRGSEERNQKILSSWMNCYELAKKYREAYGDLKIVKSFKTNDGVNYNENGKHLGEWIRTQRKARKGTSRKKLSQEQIDLLDDIDMIWEIRISKNSNEINNQENTKQMEVKEVKVLNIENDTDWLDSYELCMTYSKTFGSLIIPSTYKTSDGINYDEEGKEIGIWIQTQKQLYNKGLLEPERKELLDEIGMPWEDKKEETEEDMEKVIEIDSDGNEFEVTKKEAEEIWMRVYNIARTYRENHFSLNVSKNFVTYTGEEYNPNGYNLGRWIEQQRTLKKEGKLSQDKIDLLDDIDMIWEEVKTDYNNPIKQVKIEEELPKVNFMDLIQKEKEDLMSTNDFEEEPIEEIIDDEIVEKIIEEDSVEDTKEIEEVEPIDSRLSGICLELDETIKKIQQEKDKLIAEYKKLSDEKQELELRSQELDNEIIEVFDELRNISKKYLIKMGD